MIKEYQNIYPTRIFFGVGVTKEEYAEYFDDEDSFENIGDINCAIRANAKKDSDFIYTSKNIKKSILILIQEEDMLSMPIIIHEIMHNIVFICKYIEHGVSEEDESLAYYAEYLINCYLDFLNSVKTYPKKLKVLMKNLDLLK